MSVKVQDYTILLQEKVGQGNNPVYRAIDKNQQKICVKVIEKTSQQVEQIKREIEITKLLKGVDHNNIIKYYDIIEEQDQIYIFMESCHMSLNQYIKKKENQFSNLEYLDFLQQISSGYQKLIELNIMHRDFKIDNIVLNQDASGINYKIIDLGSGLILQSNTHRASTSAVGTFQFRAPEVNQGGNEGYDSRCDIYSLGIIILAMAGEKKIYKQEWIQYLPFKIEKNFVSQLINCKDKLPTQIQDILDCMITKSEWRMNWQYLNARVSQLLHLSQNITASSQISIKTPITSRQSESPQQKNQCQNYNQIPKIQINQPTLINQLSRVTLKPSEPTNREKPSNRFDLSRQSIPVASYASQNIVSSQNNINFSQQVKQQFFQPQQTPLSLRMNQQIPQTNLKSAHNQHEQLINSVPISNRENIQGFINSFPNQQKINIAQPQQFVIKVTETPAFAAPQGYQQHIVSQPFQQFQNNSKWANQVPQSNYIISKQSYFTK